jgi:hypothetical protein
MTGRLGSEISGKVMQRITTPAGANASLAALSVPGTVPAAAFDAAQVRAQNVAADLAERSTTMQYPAVNVYCEKIVNALTEKFRTFSGTVHMAIEVRHSQDRIEGLEDGLAVYADALLGVLNGERGDWGDGVFYCGAYQVAFGAVKHGGKNFIQTAKITFEIGVSRN